MTRRQNLYACAAERRYMLMICQKQPSDTINMWGEVVDSLYKEDWSEAAQLCEANGFADEFDQITNLSLDTV